MRWAIEGALIIAMTSCVRGTTTGDGGILPPTDAAQADASGRVNGPPVCVDGGLPDVRHELALGASFGCAIVQNEVMCWGSPPGAAMADPTPLKIQGLDMVTSIAAGEGHVCATRSDRSLWCWGDNGAGELGNGTLDASAVPVRALVDDVIDVSLGASSTCAVTGSGNVSCFGQNVGGTTVSGTYTVAPFPIDVPKVACRAKAVELGSYHRCVIDLAADVSCWGWGQYAQIANLAPKEVDGVSGARSLAAGLTHTCAVVQSGNVRCWGSGERGQLGDGMMSGEQRAAVQVPMLDDALAIAAGDGHTCAITPTKTVCWGKNTEGQLGDGTYDDRGAPTEVAIEPSTSVAAGRAHTCARGISGTVRCWGSNLNRALGPSAPAAMSSSSTPIVVAGI